MRVHRKLVLRIHFATVQLKWIKSPVRETNYSPTSDIEIPPAFPLRTGRGIRRFQKYILRYCQRIFPTRLFRSRKRNLTPTKKKSGSPNNAPLLLNLPPGVLLAPDTDLYNRSSVRKEVSVVLISPLVFPRK